MLANYVLALMAFVQSAVFYDIKERFAVNLPAGWEYAPTPGDISGVSFRKLGSGTIALFNVRVVYLPQAMTLANLEAQVTKTTSQEPGFRLLQRGVESMAGTQAATRRFVMTITGSDNLTKMVEEHMFLIGTTAYVLHVETLAEVFSLFIADFQNFWTTFQPGPVAPPADTKQHIDKTLYNPKAFIGHWFGAGHSLYLSPAGAFVLDALSGAYTLSAGTLILHIQDGRQLLYSYHMKNGVLHLSGGDFGQDGIALNHIGVSP